MYRKFSVILFTLLYLTGCNSLMNMFDSGTSNTAHTSYNDNYDEYMGDNSSTQQTYTRKRSSIDDEQPVQMTPVDNQLKMVSPEIKQKAPSQNNNKKVLLPITNDM